VHYSALDHKELFKALFLMPAALRFYFQALRSTHGSNIGLMSRAGLHWRKEEHGGH